MNLILSGFISNTLVSHVATITKPVRTIFLESGACRLEDVKSLAHVRSRVAEICNKECVDHAFVPTSGLGLKQFGMLVFDMDSTLITIECIDEIADFVGKKAEVASITEATMRGEIKDFSESLRRRVALLRGTDEAVLQRVFDERLKLSIGADALIKAARAERIYILLVSGGFTFFTQRLVQEYKLDAGFANNLEIQDGKLTGRLVGLVVGPDEKAEIVSKAMKKRQESASSVVIIGDGSNDLPMMKLVHNSIAYHAKPVVLQAATYAVRFGSLATVLDFFE